MVLVVIGLKSLNLRAVKSKVSLKQDRSSNIEKGKFMVEAEIKRTRISNRRYFNRKNIAIVNEKI